MKPFRSVLNVALLIPLVAAPALAGGSMINPGVDLFATPPGSGTSIGFADDPIPPGFFCPGSPEFTGTIYLMGEPLVTEPPQVAGTADCIVERLDSVPATGGTTALRATNPSPVRFSPKWSKFSRP